MYNFDFSNVDWDAALKAPDFLAHVIPDYTSLPTWLVEFRQQRIIDLEEERILGPRGPRVRSFDCNNWIKKNNRFEGGIRKRRLEAYPRRSGMPRPINLAQYQRHSIHLIGRVLNIRTNASPFTLILDDLNQRATPLLGELMRRSMSRNVGVVVVSFETTRFHPATRHIPVYGNHTGAKILKEIERAMNHFKESLVIVDSLYDLLNTKNVDMAELFNLVAVKFASTLIGVYHQDMLPSQNPENAYNPQPLDIFKYMATTVITCRSFAHVLAAKAAKERSLPEPTHGLLQGAEGIVQCLDANDLRGIVFEAEFRRKSGRPETETYFLRNARLSDYNQPIFGIPFGTLKQEFCILLDMVPAYASKEVVELVNAAAEEIESTFNLGLTDKQKQARDEVVLPYFDAQKGEGGEGGRILYDMGEEDDFDEEEDEI